MHETTWKFPRQFIAGDMLNEQMMVLGTPVIDGYSAYVQIDLLDEPHGNSEMTLTLGTFDEYATITPLDAV